MFCEQKNGRASFSPPTTNNLGIGQSRVLFSRVAVVVVWCVVVVAGEEGAKRPG
jgi:hypothetical protein